jgi:hypothetical protein
LKFHDLLAHGAPHCAAGGLLDRLRATEQLADVRVLVDLTRS